MTLLDWLSTVAQSGVKPLASASVRSRLLTDPFYRLQSVEEIAIAARMGIQIDANQASVDDWLRLPGISIHQARTLVELQQAGVQFHCLEDVAAAIGVPVVRLTPLAPVLRFCYYDAESVNQIPPLNPNTATVEMLLKIPIVDLYLARAIVENRKVSPYRNLSHLQQRLSLPGEIITELLHYLKF